MKRLLIALIVCVYIATAVFSAVLPVTSTAVELDGTAPSETTAATETTETTETSETTESTEATENTESTETTVAEETQPEETTPVEDEESGIQPMELTWMDYNSYLAAEMAKDEADPARNVGREAVFYVGYWQTFICAADPLNPAAGQGFFSHTELEDEDGKSIQVKITDYVVDNDGSLWYKVEALEGETLPAVMDGKPYIIHLDKLDTSGKPVLLIVPQKAMFVGETVSILNLPVAATKSVVLETENLPVFFDVIPAGGYWEEGKYWREGSWCELIDTTGWSDQLSEEYRYVTEDSVILIPPEVTLAYEALLKSETAEEYEEIWNQLPEAVRDQFTDRHLEDLNNRQEEFTTEFETTVDYGGTALNVSVSGRIPKDVTLSVSPVSYETVKSEGFDVSSATDLITALDIKLLNPDSTEWQPTHSERIYVSIDMASLGIEDETVVRLHHKHGDDITVFEVFVVLDGKIIVGVNGLSTFVVETLGDSNIAGAQEFTAGTRITMDVGEEKIFYARVRSNNGNSNPQYVDPGNPGNWVGTWEVYDPSGAIFYEVYSPDDPNFREGLWVPWIRVVALKTATDVTLTYKYAQITYNNYGQATLNGTVNTAETHDFRIDAPDAIDGTRLYLKDEINTTGLITAVLVDEDGNEIEGGLDGVSFTWTRKDGSKNMFINPRAYDNDYRSVSIVKDHAGMVEDRRIGETDAFDLVTYTVTATWADNTTKTATYTVYYQSEFLNASFEHPTVNNDHNGNYAFYPNGWRGLFWKSTAPGTNANLVRDMEIGQPGWSGRNPSATEFGVTQAAGGNQFAEVNAEEFGALYQDIISVPGETIDWEFAHAPRMHMTWNEDNTANSLFVVIGPTEEAQKLTTQAQLLALGALAKEEARKQGDAFYNNQFVTGETPVDVTYEDATYKVWYHVAGDGSDEDIYDDGGGWTDMIGEYVVPEDQYRTRLFFVSDPPLSDDGKVADKTKNFGNLVDKARAGQYKTYLIEYFEQVVEDGHSKWIYRSEVKTSQAQNADKVPAVEKGEALVYSSVPIVNLDKFIDNENDHLYKIEINGENYPYNIRYTGDASLYIEHYNGTPVYPVELAPGEKQPNNYAEYDIVMQIYLRDTMVTVQKIIEFPTAMTSEQKLELISSLPEGYQAEFELYEQGKKGTTVADGTAVTKTPNPDGTYTGFVGLDGNPLVGPTYVVEETDTTELVGLELVQVTFRTYLYSFGQGTELDQTGYGENTVNPLVNDLLSISFQFSNQTNQKVADIHVYNTYKEKDITINYVAVGNGMVSEIGVTDHNLYGDFTEIEPYYSGVVHGADVHPGYASALEGWYKDAACTDPVTSADGILEDDGTFIPNVKLIKDVDDDYEVTFYAKFVSESIVINRTNAQPYENIVYHVVSDKVDIYVTVACDENGNGSTRINEVPDGEYTVTEVKDWSWRYDEASQKKDKASAGTSDDRNFELVFDFNGEEKRRNWLNGWDEIAKNVFKGGLS